MTSPTGDASLLPMLPMPAPSREAADTGYAWETPVWPRVQATLVEPPVVTACADDPDAEFVYITWMDDASIPPRIRHERLVKTHTGGYVHSNWVDEPDGVLSW